MWQCVRLQCFGICIGEYGEKETKKATKSLLRSHLSIKAQNRVVSCINITSEMLTMGIEETQPTKGFPAKSDDWSLEPRTQMWQERTIVLWLPYVPHGAPIRVYTCTFGKGWEEVKERGKLLVSTPNY